MLEGKVEVERYIKVVIDERYGIPASINELSLEAVAVGKLTLPTDKGPVTITKTCEDTLTNSDVDSGNYVEIMRRLEGSAREAVTKVLERILTLYNWASNNNIDFKIKVVGDC